MTAVLSMWCFQIGQGHSWKPYSIDRDPWMRWSPPKCFFFLWAHLDIKLATAFDSWVGSLCLAWAWSSSSCGQWAYRAGVESYWSLMTWMIIDDSSTRPKRGNPNVWQQATYSLYVCVGELGLKHVFDVVVRAHGRFFNSIEAKAAHSTRVAALLARISSIACNEVSAN